MTNTNCLEGIRCPNCAQEQPIRKQLTSTAMFHTPGLFRALQNDFGIEGKIREHAVKTLSDGYGLPPDEARALLSGSIPVEINEAAGTITYEAECRRERELPPDPDDKNDERAAWAGAALARFMEVTGADLEDSVGDLLTDLMHWSDRNNYDFDAALDRARFHYDAETTPDSSPSEAKTAG